MNNRKAPSPTVDINRLRNCAESLTQAMQIANSYCENNPGITLIKQNLQGLSNMIKAIDK